MNCTLYQNNVCDNGTDLRVGLLDELLPDEVVELRVGEDGELYHELLLLPPRLPQSRSPWPSAIPAACLQ